MSENKLPFNHAVLIQYFRPNDIDVLPQVSFMRIYDGINPVSQYNHQTGKKVFAEIASDVQMLKDLQFIIVEVEKGRYKKLTFLRNTNRFDKPAIGFKQQSGYVKLAKENRHHLLSHINSFYKRVEE